MTPRVFPLRRFLLHRGLAGFPYRKVNKVALVSSLPESVNEGNLDGTN